LAADDSNQNALAGVGSNEQVSAGAAGRMTTMATLPADEDYARALLAIFRAKKIGLRQSLRVGEVRTSFLARNMGTLSDFEAAVDYAITCGWLWRGFDSLRLTGPGDEEIQTMSLGRGLDDEPPGGRPPARPSSRGPVGRLVRSRGTQSLF
jgi:hypothetical protein